MATVSCPPAQIVLRNLPEANVAMAIASYRFFSTITKDQIILLFLKKEDILAFIPLRFI